jgi:hypothetical protein
MNSRVLYSRHGVNRYHQQELALQNRHRVSSFTDSRMNVRPGSIVQHPHCWLRKGPSRSAYLSCRTDRMSSAFANLCDHRRHTTWIRSYESRTTLSPSETGSPRQASATTFGKLCLSARRGHLRRPCILHILLLPEDETCCPAPSEDSAAKPHRNIIFACWTVDGSRSPKCLARI